MASDYTSWKGLVDRTYTGRHLPAVDPSAQADLPSEGDVNALFLRDVEIESTDTSVMFVFFAQWFTDSFLRTDHSDMRKNTSNHEIDLCQIYGLTEAKTSMLRSHVGGRMKSQLIDGLEYPAYIFKSREPGGALAFKDEFVGLHDEKFFTEVILGDAPDDRKDFVFAAGLEHGNSTIGNTIMNVIFLREHNRTAGMLAAAYPDWDDDRLFETARNVMIVMLLNVVVEEYISHIAPLDFPLEKVKFAADGAPWNRSNWMAIEFDLLYRWHPLVPDVIDGAHSIGWQDFRNNNPLVLARGVENLVEQFSNAKSGRIGLLNTPSFLVERKNPAQPSVQERTISLMRFARLASFNDYREAFNLSPVESFDELTSDPEVRVRLKELYGTIDNLEWYVGIFAEDYSRDFMMGELLTVMVAYDAFTQALTNPLLARHVYNEHTFSPEGLQQIETTKSLGQIVARNAPPGKAPHVSFKV